MNTFKDCADIILQLEATNSKNDKLAILEKAYKDGHTDFFKYTKMVFDPLITFGVKQVPKHADIVKPMFTDNNEAVEEFDSLLRRLEERRATGHEARDSITNVGLAYNEHEWDNFLRLVLIKDLKCGVSDRSINKALKNVKADKEFFVPERGCQLATDIAKVIEKYTTGLKYVDIKYDGVRIYTVIDVKRKEVVLHTRNGKVNTNFPLVKEELEPLLSTLTESIVLDGEIMSGQFNALMTQVNRKSNVETTDSIYHVFDCIPLEDFINQFSPLTQEQRLVTVHSLPKFDHIVPVNQELINLDTEKGRERVEKIMQTSIDNGFEGIMLKDPTAPYECKRRKHWLKQKPWIEVTLKVVGTYPGQPDTRLENTIGGLNCEGEDEGKIIRVDVGSGLTDDMRDDILNNKEKVIGSLIEVRADCFSQNKDEKDLGIYSLRFPRFKCFRELIIGEGKI